VGGLALLAACGNSLTTAPQGPYASATPAPAQRVINRGCANAAHEGPEATDISFMETALLRQEADLQRVGDDLSGAVPGGDINKDPGLAQANAAQLVSLVSKSTLCSPFREDLASAAAKLATADDTLASSVGGGDVNGALQASLAAFQALKAIADHPPTPVVSPSPAPSAS
jgi:hypothetical protein